MISKPKQKDYDSLRNENDEETVISGSTDLTRETAQIEKQGSNDSVQRKSLRKSLTETFITPVKKMMSHSSQVNADNRKFMELLAMARESSEETLKEIDQIASQHPLIRAWNHGPLQPFCLWLLWLFVGTMYYGSANFNGDFSKGFYYSVNVGYSIGWGVLHDHSTGCKVFSIFHLLIGAMFVSRWLAYLLEKAIKDQDNHNAYDTFVLQRNLRRNNPFAQKSPILSEIYVYLALNANRLLIIYLWLIYIFVGAAWSCVVIGWPMIDGVYFSLSSLSTGGLWGIPVDSPDLSFVLVGLFAATGVPLMGMAMADLAALIVALRQQTQSNLFGKVDLNQQEKLLLDIFRNDPERGDIDKNEFLLFHLVKRKLVPLNAIRELSTEFERLDVNGAGVITYQDVATIQSRKKTKTKQADISVKNPLQATGFSNENEDDVIR